MIEETAVAFGTLGKDSKNAIGRESRNPCTSIDAEDTQTPRSVRSFNGTAIDVYLVGDLTQNMPPNPTFEVEITGDDWQADHFLIGTSTIGLAGLTAVDHLVKSRQTQLIGHIATKQLPDITPFESGTPRLQLRIYADRTDPVVVLVSELFIPVWAADAFVTAVLSWVDQVGPERITILHGVPFPHGPEEHDVFVVASPNTLVTEFKQAGIRPMEGGYLDGIAGELMAAQLMGSAPPTAALVTPTHPPGPDFEAAVRLLEALKGIYGVSVDKRELHERAEEMRQYYEELADRMARFERGDQPIATQDFPDDRMYM